MQMTIEDWGDLTSSGEITAGDWAIYQKTGQKVNFTQLLYVIVSVHLRKWLNQSQSTKSGAEKLTSIHGNQTEYIFLLDFPVQSSQQWNIPRWSVNTKNIRVALFDEIPEPKQTMTTT